MYNFCKCDQKIYTGKEYNVLKKIYFYFSNKYGIANY